MKISLSTILATCGYLTWILGGVLGLVFEQVDAVAFFLFVLAGSIISICGYAVGKTKVNKTWQLR